MNTDSLIRKAKKLAYADNMPEGYHFIKKGYCSRITDVMKVGNNIVVADRHGSLFKVTKKQLEEMVDCADNIMMW